VGAVLGPPSLPTVTALGKKERVTDWAAPAPPWVGASSYVKEEEKKEPPTQPGPRHLRFDRPDKKGGEKKGRRSLGVSTSTTALARDSNLLPLLHEPFLLAGQQVGNRMEGERKEKKKGNLPSYTPLPLHWGEEKGGGEKKDPFHSIFSSLPARKGGEEKKGERGSLRLPLSLQPKKKEKKKGRKACKCSCHRLTTFTAPSPGQERKGKRRKRRETWPQGSAPFFYHSPRPVKGGEKDLAALLQETIAIFPRPETQNNRGRKRKKKKTTCFPAPAVPRIVFRLDTTSVGEKSSLIVPAH